MITSIVLAKVFGIFLFIMGIGSIRNHQRISGAISEIFEFKIIQLILGIIPLLIGSFIVSIHNMWILYWTVIITLLGWIFLLIGIIRLIFTEFWLNRVKSMQDKVSLKFSGSITALIGLVLMYFGFFG
jgi:hypothetical protein